MNKRQKIISLSAIIVIILFAAVIGAMFFFQTNRAKSKTAIDNEANNTTTPTSCTEETRNYSQGDGIDSTATWYMTYSCSDSLDTIHLNVKAAAEKNGYTINSDNVTNNSSANFYSAQLCLTRNGYISNWNFNSNTNTFDSSGKPLGLTVSLYIHSAKYSPCS